MIEFFFDCSSPWTYLAFHNIQPLAKEFGEEISWRPILVGGIFNSINPSVYASREHPVPAKVAYQKKDMADWARSTGLDDQDAAEVFPVNSVKAMRGCIFLGKEMLPFARAVFEIYWGEDKDISQNAVLTEVCQRVGVDPAKFFAGIGDQAIKDQLKANTDEVMARGGFGSPITLSTERDVCWQLPCTVVREALAAPQGKRGLNAEGGLLPGTGAAGETGAGDLAAAPLAPGQVRVAIHAAGINFPDILMAAGEYQLKPELPFIPGMEAAGEVIEVDGAARGVAVGDRVMVKLRQGGYAEEAVVAPAQLTPLPSTFDYAEGATFLAAYGTAYHGLVDRARLQPGEALLVHGAGGGVGLAAVESASGSAQP